MTDDELEFILAMVSIFLVIATLAVFLIFYVYGKIISMDRGGLEDRHDRYHLDETKDV